MSIPNRTPFQMGKIYQTVGGVFLARITFIGHHYLSGTLTDKNTGKSTGDFMWLLTGKFKYGKNTSLDLVLKTVDRLTPALINATE